MCRRASVPVAAECDRILWCQGGNNVIELGPLLHYASSSELGLDLGKPDLRVSVMECSS